MPTTILSRIRFLVNTGRRDCVTGWNLAAKNSTGEILIQVSDDLFPPNNCYYLIRSLIKQFSLERSDVVFNLLDERREKNAVFHPVLTRSAFEKLPYLYPPDFESMFCDNWFCSFHKKNSMYVTSDQVFWNHFHRTTHDVEKDEVMSRHESPERYKRGRQIFFKYIKEQGLDKL